MDRDLPPPPRPTAARSNPQLGAEEQGLFAEDWRLYALFRPGAIYVHIYKPGKGTQPVRLSVAGLGEGARAALAGLTTGQRVPRDISEPLFRLNRLC